MIRREHEHAVLYRLAQFRTVLSIPKRRRHLEVGVVRNKVVACEQQMMRRRLRRDGQSFFLRLSHKLDALRLTLDGQAAGTWQVERNDISWGEGGFRQRLTIGTKLS